MDEKNIFSPFFFETCKDPTICSRFIKKRESNLVVSELRARAPPTKPILKLGKGPTCDHFLGDDPGKLKRGGRHRRRRLAFFCNGVESLRVYDLSADDDDDDDVNVAAPSSARSLSKTSCRGRKKVCEKW